MLWVAGEVDAGWRGQPEGQERSRERVKEWDAGYPFIEGGTGQAIVKVFLDLSRAGGSQELL
jgi:hypothetical protein